MFEEQLKILRKSIYEPEHFSTMCWCEPKFIKRPDGKLEIVHLREKDRIVDFIRTYFGPK